MRRSAVTCFFLALYSLLSSGVSSAADIAIPEDLEDWRAWVLDGYEYRGCPFHFDSAASHEGQFICAWPGELDLEVAAGGARFSQAWDVLEKASWLPLPGDANHWPGDVRVNGENVPVVLHDNAPSVFLQPGRYEIEGTFGWDSRPGVLRVPASVGRLALTVDGSRIARPQLSPEGVFLGEPKQQGDSPDSLSVDIYRLLEDGIPARLYTRLEINVSGSVREENIGPILPEKWTPMQLAGPLSTKLEPNGSLRLQLRPGRWTMLLVARAPDEIDTSGPPAAGGQNLPPEEIWSYRDRDSLRVTSVSGSNPVDPAQAGVPAEWQGLPAFRLVAGERISIEERSRGRSHTDNELVLERRMWFDFSRTGYTVLDNLDGTMRSAWRLDMLPPYDLRSAQEEGADLLITAGDAEGATGVELRQTQVALEALARTGRGGSIPVTGWDARFSAVSTTLYLPPGNKLLAASGADAAVGSWAARWQLLDYFLVLLITIAAWKLFGRAAGVVALGALVLSFHEHGAPAWLWLNLLAAVALLRVAPEGRLRLAVRAWAGLGAVLLLFALVPFVASQVRIALYPQLEVQRPVYYPGRTFSAVPAAAPPEVRAEFIGEAKRAAESQNLSAGKLQSPADDEAMEEILVTGVLPVSEPALARYAPGAVIQTGPGIPNWEWNRYELNWNAPVDAGQTMRLLVLPRWAVSLLRFAEVGLLLLFVAVVAANALGRQWRLPGGLRFGDAPAAMSLVLVTMLPLLPDPVPAQAQTPDPAVLEQLRDRLLAAPDCVPRCAEISRARIEVIDNEVQIELVVDALEQVAIPLPGTVDGWRATTVLVAGNDDAKILRDAGQRFWLRADAGRQTVTMRGPAGQADRVELRFPAPPRIVSASADGWLIEGIRDRRLLSGAVQLSRLKTGDVDDVRWENNQFPPFVEVIRAIDLGLDWRVSTIVRRVAPSSGTLTVAIPLLPNESVLSPDTRVRDALVEVTLGPGQGAVSWQSNLPRQSPLVLAATDSTSWTETWRFGIGSTWHVEFSGVPESAAADSHGGVRTAVFHPRPGESLQVSAVRPEAVAGGTLAFDSVDLRVEQGSRLQTNKLGLAYRSTRGAQHVLALPPGSELVEVTIDGVTEPLTADDGQLTLPVLPGKHSIDVTWQLSHKAGLWTSTPALDIGAPASNLSLHVELSTDRWLLLTAGPPLGPAVLYWAELAVLVLFAWLLARIDWTPLRFHHWLLLGLGFSTFNWPAFGLVVLWLLATGARNRWRVGDAPWLFNLQQLALVILTLAALLAIIVGLPNGLLGHPDMQVTGHGSGGNFLSWFADRTDGVLPAASAVSLPMWVYKALILAWALWLSLALLKWLPWTWQCFSRDGFFRRHSRKSRKLRQGDPA